MRFTGNIDFTKTASDSYPATGTGLKTIYYGKIPVCYWGTYGTGSFFRFSLLPLTIPKGFRHHFYSLNAGGTATFSASEVTLTEHFQMMMMMDIKRSLDIETLVTRTLQTSTVTKINKRIGTLPIHEQYEAYELQRVIDDGGTSSPPPNDPIPYAAKGCIGSLLDKGAIHYFIVNEGTPEQHHMIPVVFPSMFIGYYKYTGAYITIVIEKMAEFHNETATGVRSFPFEVAPDGLILDENLAGIVYIDDLTYPHKNVPGSSESVQISFNDLTNAYSPAPDLS